MTHARATDPDTSHLAAALVKMNEQRYRVLGSYYQQKRELTDHEAYALARIDYAHHARQRCSDLRQAGWIERTGNKGVTPSNKPAHKCAITLSGMQAYEGWAIFYGGNE